MEIEEIEKNFDGKVACATCNLSLRTIVIRAGGRTPLPPVRGGGGGGVGSHLPGPHFTLRMIFCQFFNVFKIFVKIFVQNEIYR